MKNVAVIGQSSRKAAVLEWLQDLGCMHLVEVPADQEPSSDIKPRGRRRNYEALRYLLNCPDRLRAYPEDHDVDVREVVERITENRQRRRDVGDRLDQLSLQIEALEPWGNFTRPEPEQLGGLRLWFYRVPRHQLSVMEGSADPWQVVNRDTRWAYTVLLARDEPDADVIPWQPEDLPNESLETLRDRFRKAEIELDVVRQERSELTRWTQVLLYQLLELDNRAALEEAAAHVVDDGNLFTVTGWVPVHSVDALEEFCVSVGVACAVRDPGTGESPPVLLENKGPLAAGEELVKFFQLPGYDDWDPSSVVLASFVLFTAMIFSDAGYAVVFGALVLAGHRKLGATAKGRRIRRIGYYATVIAFAYGILVGSYFGASPAEGTLAARLHLLDVHDFDSMMGLSIIVGCLHLVIANVATGLRRLPRTTSLSAFGWSLVILGGLVLLDGTRTELPQILTRVATWVTLVGAAGILFFSSDLPFNTPSKALLRLFEGLKGITGVTMAFGDVLSYLRLFALGLASASLAVTFNDLAASVNHAVPGIGILAAILILAIGHGLNLVLCVIGGLVHGLRLNLIEFYHWSIYGEGSPFRAFRKKETVSWTQ